jgi:hypothetical protein
MHVNKGVYLCYLQLDPIDVGISPELEGQVTTLLKDLSIEPVPEVGLYMTIYHQSHLFQSCILQAKKINFKAQFHLGKFSAERPNTNFPSGKNFEVENFQLLTMLFSENVLSVEIFLEWK